jgi:hypothetical protein
MPKQSENGISKSLDHIEQIRDIIFGPQKREYDDRFSQLTAEMKRNKGELVARTDELHAQLREKITTGLDALDKSLRQLTAKMESEDAALQQLIEKTEKKLSADLGTLAQKVDEHNTALRKELSDTRSRFQAELNAVREEATRNLDAESTRLRESKVSRDVMAELLHELAMKLEGVEMLAELQRAARKKSAE